MEIQMLNARGSVKDLAESAANARDSIQETAIKIQQLALAKGVFGGWGCMVLLLCFAFQFNPKATKLLTGALGNILPLLRGEKLIWVSDNVLYGRFWCFLEHPKVLRQRCSVLQT